VHRALWTAGFPCPEPLVDLQPLDGHAATAETLVPGAGQPPPDSELAVLSAAALARLVELAPDPGSVPSLAPSPSFAGWDHSGPGLWVANWNLSDPQAAAEINAAGGPYPVIGVQFASGAFYDTNVFSTTWLNATSHMAGTGPFLHHADGKHSLNAIASKRGTTVEHLMDVTAKAATAADKRQMAGLVLPNGWPYYTSNA
jgi:hypothetical protein